MERTGWVDKWAGVGMLMLCLVIGAVEGALVFSRGSWRYFVPWLVAFLGFLASLLVLAVRSAPLTTRARGLGVAAPVLLSSVVVLLSPNGGGLGFILLVVTAAGVSLHLDLRGISAVIVWNTAVVTATGAALGPLVAEPLPAGEILLGTVLYALLQAAVAAMAWSGQRVEQALRDLSVAHVELRSTSALLAESSQAEERLRISRELHDVLGHQLTVQSVELEVAAHRVEGPAREHVLRARGMARDLLRDVRSVVGSERGRNFDLREALRRVTEEIPRPRVHLEIAPGIEMEHGEAAALVRAVQEIATNTIRHAWADNLWISLTTEGDMVCLEAKDDGHGVASVVPGNGLRGLRERAEALGGQLEIDPEPGFRVRVLLPARAREKRPSAEVLP